MNIERPLDKGGSNLMLRDKIQRFWLEEYIQVNENLLGMKLEV